LSHSNTDTVTVEVNSEVLLA